VHAALAAATDPAADPDRRAWHLAWASPGPDEEIAAELERSASRARARGGMAAAAAFLDRAAVLTLDPMSRSRRALEAAQAKTESGAFAAADRLLDLAEADPLDDLQTAQVDLLRGRLAFARSSGSEASGLLLKAARRFESLDARVACDTYLEALEAAVVAGRLATADVVEIAEAARHALASAEPDRPLDLLLNGLAVRITDGNAAGVPLLRRALHQYMTAELPVQDELRSLWLAGHAASLLWDYETWDQLSARLVFRAREVGALGTLPLALSTRAGIKTLAGELGEVASIAAEIEAIIDVTGGNAVRYGLLAGIEEVGLKGRGAQGMENAQDDVTRRGEGGGLTTMQWVAVAANNATGRYEDAFAIAELASATSHPQEIANWMAIEHVEAASRTGHIARANAALERLSDSLTASNSDWGRGTEACVRALLSDGASAEAQYQDAIDRLARTRLRIAHGRARLLYGEWLRRQHRRIEAREQLGMAHELFEQSGLTIFAERAGIELRATGQRARKRVEDTRDELTPQESQIARMVAEGATNREVAAQLFLSPSTVDYHLRKAFRKLGVRSRTQLARHFHP
jgi:DNA-binding CsgD family transcriptional regulator